jgi:NADP-dependent 3-hydroxy acid dehydrogenase YdfG
MAEGAGRDRIGRALTAISVDARDAAEGGELEETMSSSTPLAGRRVLLTGASAGIGRATAQALAGAGATVLATGRRAERLDTLARDLADAPGTVEFLAGDLTDPAFVQELVDWAGTPDVLVNNAGQVRHAPFLESDPADWAAVFESNVLSVLRLTQAVARRMSERKSGHVINVTSVLAGEVTIYTLAYAASKHALRAIGEGLRLELRPHGIKVTEVAPGLVTTEINREIRHPGVRDYYEARSRRFPYLEPADIAAAILYAVSAGPNVSPERLEIRPARQA